MPKVNFNIEYEILPENRDEYLKAMKELKSMLKTEGLEHYFLFESNNKKNLFKEIMIFKSAEEFDNYDDSSDERMNILLARIEKLKVPKTSKLTTLTEVELD
jgi:hypothetical protein